MAPRGFRFRLQALLRRWEVEEERQEFALATLEAELQRLREERVRAGQDVERSRQECTRLLASRPTPGEILEQFEDTAQCRLRVADLEKRIAVVTAERERVEALRLHAARERRRMEIARERELKSYLEEQARLEGIHLDELGVLGSARRRREEDAAGR